MRNLPVSVALLEMVTPGEELFGVTRFASNKLFNAQRLEASEGHKPFCLSNFVLQDRH